jgi:hypothetical protein
MGQVLAIGLLLIALILIFGTIPAIVVWNRRHTKRRGIKTSKDIRPCVLCNERKAGLKLRQRTLTGLVIATSYRTFDDYACPHHARTIHDSFQNNNMLKGWWSISGLLQTPIMISENRMYYKVYRDALATIRTQ